MKTSVLFSNLDSETLRGMLADYRREIWPKGGHLPSAQVADLFTVVISGRVELRRTNPLTGRQMTLFLLGPGDAFDVIALLDGHDHETQPVAVEPLEIITAPIASVRRWIERHPSFNRSFLPHLGQRMRELEDLSADLALSETVTRLAKLIIQQATPESEQIIGEPPPTPLINTLSDEAMARMIGSVRAVVNRHLQDFIQRGLISTSHGKLVVHDLAKLKEHCERLL
ncbi:Crp/Fnr family transcriptional regulator [Candidatus Sumerlaeota bacterium]|nr:Crp/Fnr family transcriptional regulator [Candidatus Sumerlaeota bacterium]